MDAFAFSLRQMLGALAEPVGSARTLSFGALAGPLGSALAARAYFLLLRQKKVAKEKATPGSAPATRVPCATRPTGRLAKLACGSDRRKPKAPGQPALLSASQGDPKGVAAEPVEMVFGCFQRSTAKKYRFPFSWAEPLFRDAFPGPHVERRATELMAEKGRGLSEARKAEFRSPRQQRVAQGSRRSRPRSLGSPFLWLLSFGEAKESTPARKAEPCRQTGTAFPVAETKAKPARKAEPPRQTRTTPSVSKTPRKGGTITEHSIRR